MQAWTTILFLCMMNYLRSIIISIAIISSVGSLCAQDHYIYGFGLRGGPLFGATYKHFIGVPSVIEGIVGFNATNGRRWSLTGLYQHHFFINYQLNWFGGAGLSMSVNKQSFRLLGEAMLGLEYTMPRFPINISIDYKPAIHIFKGQLFWNEFGISARYIVR